MVETVDSIVAELIARVDGYVRDFDKATAAHGRFFKSAQDLSKFSFDLNAEAQKYKSGAASIGQAEEALTTRVTRSRKARADAAVAADEREVASAKKAAAEREATEAATQQRISAMIDRTAARQEAQRRKTGGASLGATVPREATGQQSIPTGYLAGGTAAVTAETEVNHLLADRFDLAARAKVAEGAIRTEMRDEIDYLRRIETYRRAGLTDAEATVRAEGEIAAIEKLRADRQARSGLKDIGRFAEGAGIGRTGGSGYAVAGIATAAVVAGVAEAVKTGLDYAHSLKEVSDQLGVTTHDLQIYQVAAQQVGVSNEQLREAFGQLASNIGKAKLGNEEFRKFFIDKNLNIDLSQYKGLSDLLPTLVDRLGKVPDQQKRLAIETALGGEQLRKLDPILSQGTNAFNDYARSIDATGTILSNSEIQNADRTANKIKQLNDQLQRQLAGVVAQNVEAIDSLATSFFKLAAGAIQAVSAMQRFGARRILDLPFAPEDKKREARQFMNSTNEGRAEMRAMYTQKLREIHNGGFKSYIPGILDIPGVGYFKDTKDGRDEAVRKIQQQNAETVRAQADADAADAASRRKPDGNSPGNLNKLFAPKGPKGKSADALEKEAAARQKAYLDQLGRLSDQELQARSDVTQDELQRSVISRELLRRENERRIADIALQVKERRINASDAPALVKQSNKTYEADLAKLVQQDQLELLKRDYQLGLDQLDAAKEVLQSRQALAKTEAERKKIALALLANDEARENLETDNVLNRYNLHDASLSTTDLQAAQERQRTQPKRFGLQRAQIDQEHASPLEKYKQQLHEATDDTTAALESVAVNGFGRLEDQLANTIGNVLHLKGAFGDLVTSILTDLARIELEKGFLKLLGGGDSGSSSSGGGIFSAVLGALLGGGSRASSAGTKSAGSLLGGIAASVLGHRADGGPVVAGGSYLVGERGPEVVQFNAAGRVFPNGRLPAAAGGANALTLQQHIHVDGRNSVTPAGFAQQIIDVANEHANKVAAQAGRTAVEASPGRVNRLRTLGI